MHSKGIFYEMSIGIDELAKRPETRVLEYGGEVFSETVIELRSGSLASAAL